MAEEANPLYDPGWEAKHRAHAQVAEKWRVTAENLAQKDGFGAPRHIAAMEARDLAQAAAAKAWLSQHKTIAAYAAARFASLNGTDLGVIVDISAFRSLSEADAAFEHARLNAPETRIMNEMSLPVRQPAGLAAFAEGAEIISSRRRFEPAELSPHPAPGDTALDCMVVFHQLGEEFHICLAHRWGAFLRSSRDQFRNIATVLARQTIELLHAEAREIFHGGKHGQAEYRALIRDVNAAARRFHFYRHALPSRDLREEFCRVDMGWDGARFIDPDWSSALYDSLPPVLRAASETFVG